MFEENSSKIVFLFSIISSFSLAALIIILPTFHFSMQKRLSTIISIANDCKLESKNLWRDLNKQSSNTERFRRETNYANLEHKEKGNNINVCCACKQGRPGPPGKEGKPGRSGKDGLPGQRGWTGRAGKYIEAQKDETGTDSCLKCYPGIPGPPGPPGLKGLPGLAGEPGKPGKNGKSSKNGLTGAAGPRGEPGLPGPTGPQGDPGRVLNGAPPGQPGAVGLPGPRGPPGKSGKDGDWGMPGDKGIKGLMGQRGENGVVGMPGPNGAIGEPGHPGGCWHCKQDLTYQQTTSTLYYSSISPPTASPPQLFSNILENKYNLIKEKTTQIPLFKPIKEEEKELNNKAYGQIQINKINTLSPSIPIQIFPPSYEKEEPKKFNKKNGGGGPIQLATFFGYGIGGNYRREDIKQQQIIKFGRDEEEEGEFININNKEENNNNKAVLV